MRVHGSHDRRNEHRADGPPVPQERNPRDLPKQRNTKHSIGAWSAGNENMCEKRTSLHCQLLFDSPYKVVRSPCYTIDSALYWLQYKNTLCNQIMILVPQQGTNKYCTFVARFRSDKLGGPTRAQGQLKRTNTKQ